jgi:calcineurin-like phosphoesterase family protein
LGISSTGGHILRRAGALLLCAALAGALVQEARGATFGKTTVGASTNYASSEYVLASRFTLGVQGTVSKLTASLSGSGTSGFQAVRGVVYADSGGVPTALKGSTQEVQVAWSKTRGWVDLTFAAPVSLPAGDYWLGLHGGPRTGDALTWYGYDFLAAGQRSKYDAYSNGASDPFGTTSSKDRSMSIYATYTQAGSTPPASTSPPAVSGTAQEGQTLQATPGTWTGTEPISFSYRWLRCDTAGNACTPFATGSSYTLGSADVGSRLRVEVTASNAAGGATATSPPTGVVTSKPLTDPVIAAAGDIGCDPVAWNYNGGIGSSSACHQKQVSDLLLGGNLSAVLPLGDLQYECSPLSALTQAYAPTWGRVKSISRPILGNHEYYTDADVGSVAHTSCDNMSGLPPNGYFAYFGSAAGEPTTGYYSYDIGSWHLVALNSNCSKISCSIGSTQERWLRADLAAHPSSCTLAYFHHPRFNSDGTGQATGTQPLWQALYDLNADVVLAGHAHDYERFAPQTPAGVYDAARGVREFVVGTGGKSHSSWVKDVYGTPLFKPNSQAHDNITFGVLRLTLHASSYDWQFVPEAGKTFTDSGSAACH